MKASLTAAIAAMESAAIALAVYAGIALVAFSLWWVTFGLSAEPSDVASGVSAVWLLGHLVPLTFTVPAELMLMLGLTPEPLAFAMTLTPLGVTATTVLLALRMGARFAQRGGAGFAGVLGGTLGFAVSAWVVTVFGQSFLSDAVWVAVLIPTAVFLLAAGAGFFWGAIRAEHQWWEALTRSVLRRVSQASPHAAGAMPAVLKNSWRLAGVLGAAFVMLSGIAVCVACALGYVEYVTVSQGLQLTGFGAVVLFVVQLSYLPNLFVWALSWLTGMGFHVGTEASFSPFGNTPGSLPALPLSGLVPQSWGWAAALAPALILCVCVCVGALFAGLPQVRSATWASLILISLNSTVIVTLAVAGAGAISSGSFGPGTFGEAGVSAWPVAGMIAALSGVGTLLGMCARRSESLWQPRDTRLGDVFRLPRAGAQAPSSQTQVGAAADDLPGVLSEPKTVAGSTQTMPPHSAESEPEKSSLLRVAPVPGLDSDAPAALNNTEALLRQYAWNPGQSPSTDETSQNTTRQLTPDPKTSPILGEASAETVPLEKLHSSALGRSSDAGEPSAEQKQSILHRMQKWRRTASPD